ncbi:MAG: ricin-type beta-trefoil lectin domain protein [Sandaracinaceae bacterium]|nr:ricin-type beta-trefoil lectin domain protein [Sandaracinaceae bacterium]
MRATVVLASLSLVLGLSLATSSADAQRRRPGRGAHLSGWFTVVSEGGLCLEVHGGEAGRDGARVQMWTCHGGANQLWRFERGTLVSAAGGCLDVHGGDLANRHVNGPLARVHTWSCHGNVNQQWRIDPGASALVSAAGGCLDVEAGAIHQVGQRAISWTCHGQVNQRFRLQPVIRRGPPGLAATRRRRPARRHGRRLLRRLPRAHPRRVLLVRSRRGRPRHRPHAWLTAAQIRTVLSAMSFSSERVEVLELLVPRMVDRQNGAAILDALSFSSERDRAQQLLAQAPPAQPW